MAEFKYTMKDLSRLIDRTPARIYTYFKEDKEYYFSEINRKKDNKRGYLYNDAVLERLKNKLLIEDGETQQKNFSEGANLPLLTAPPIDDELRQMSKEKERLSAELEDLKGKFEALQANFEKANGELDDLKRENGFKSEEIQRLLLIIQQEKQEKAQIMLMLPPPRKSIGEKIKALFKRKDTPRKGV